LSATSRTSRCLSVFRSTRSPSAVFAAHVAVDCRHAGIHRRTGPSGWLWHRTRSRRVTSHCSTQLIRQASSSPSSCWRSPLPKAATRTPRPRTPMRCGVRPRASADGAVRLGLAQRQAGAHLVRHRLGVECARRALFISHAAQLGRRPCSPPRRSRTRMACAEALLILLTCLRSAAPGGTRLARRSRSCSSP